MAIVQYQPTGDRDRNLERVSQMIDVAVERGAELVLLPELFAVPFVPTESDDRYIRYAEPLDGPSGQLAAMKSAAHGITILSTVFEAAALEGVYYNSACAYVGGEHVLTYRKSHIPLSHHFAEKRLFRPGDEPPAIFHGAGTTLGVIICYERHFPELLRVLALRGAQLALIPAAAANDSRAIFHAELRGHAIANQMFVAAANRVGTEGSNSYYGLSVVYGPTGEQVAVAREGEEEVLVANLDLALVGSARREFPFYRDRRPELYTAVARAQSHDVGDDI